MSYHSGLLYTLLCIGMSFFDNVIPLQASSIHFLRGMTFFVKVIPIYSIPPFSFSVWLSKNVIPLAREWLSQELGMTFHRKVIPTNPYPYDFSNLSHTYSSSPSQYTHSHSHALPLFLLSFFKFLQQNLLISFIKC